MGASQRRLLAAAAALAIASSSIGSIAPAIAAPTTVTNTQVTEPTSSPTTSAEPVAGSTATRAPAETSTQAPSAKPSVTASTEPAAPVTAAPRTLQVEASAGYPLYKIVYDSTIYEMLPGAGATPIPNQISFERWRDVYNFQTPTPASTDFVKYPWSPTVYAVTFWSGVESYWMWTRLSFEQWKTAGYPIARNAGWIKGSYYYQWGTSSEIFVLGEDGVNHKLTGQEWADSGYRPYDHRSNEGLLKLTWAPEIAWMTNLATGAGRPMGYAEWQKEAFPSARAVQRITGDMFYKDCGSSTIWYAGPGMNRPVSAQEWHAAGSPSPTISGNCTPPPPSQPARPADRDCSDFRSQYEAQQWFNTYYPYYGDFAMLDSDNDGIACEYLP